MARAKSKGALGGSFSSARIPKSTGKIPNNGDSQGSKRLPGKVSSGHAPGGKFKSARIPKLHDMKHK